MLLLWFYLKVELNTIVVFLFYFFKSYDTKYNIMAKLVKEALNFYLTLYIVHCDISCQENLQVLLNILFCFHSYCQFPSKQKI